MIMREYKNAICVSGTHGKTTTTGMLTHIFMQAQRDPTVMMGGYLPLLHAGHRVGSGDTIIMESCEYCDSFLNFYPDIRAAYKQVERVSADKLLELLPEALRPSYAPLVRESDPTVHDIVKAADKLSAHIKCIEELRAGNQEFASAAEQTRQALTDMHLPELDWFLEHCLDSFGKNLDQLE